MQVNVYPWQHDTWQHWQKLLGQDRLHHAVLLASPKGSGRIALTAMLAKTILCKNGVAEPCGVCHSCKLFDADTHPDFHLLKPEAEGKQIGVDAVRKVNQYAWETSQLGGQRVILIQDADRMGEAAANAVLKTLEEPPSNCHFILLAVSMDTMLPTVVSRCNKWKPKLPQESVVKRWVEAELFDSVPLQVIRINRGAPLAAKAFVESGSLGAHEGLLDAFSGYVTTKQGLFTLTEKLIKSGNDGLQWLSFLLLDVMKLQQGTQEGLVHCESLPLVEKIGRAVSASVVMRQLTALNKLKSDLVRSTGLNNELMVSRWLSDFQ
ncbi:DNA polymerase III subunit delta' [Enterovibrio norvegicus]|uniref:DNA polymerase III subunit delta' n=1 Tax=Enterovibrio norvegicus TaxID=188144 RepID=UPI0013D5BC87|nr:DNA polymerase III subunit delta' [Enterovibrio norvegicus]